MFVQILHRSIHHDVEESGLAGVKCLSYRRLNITSRFHASRLYAEARRKRNEIDTRLRQV